MTNSTPPSFVSTDIGNPALKGSSVQVEGGYDVTGGGADIWGARDEFQFLYTHVQGDFDIRAKLAGLSAADPYTKAGLMAREGLDENARHAYFQVFPDNSDRNSNNGGYEYQYRSEAGGDMKAIYPPTSTGTPPFPVNFPDTWLRLTRVSNLFVGYSSCDGSNWTAYSSIEHSFPRDMNVGMAVTSHNEARLAGAKFRNIALV